MASGDFFWRKFCEKYCITHSKLGKGAKSIEIVSSGPIIFAHLFQLAHEISQIRSIVSSLMHLFLTRLRSSPTKWGRVRLYFALPPFTEFLLQSQVNIGLRLGPQVKHTFITEAFRVVFKTSFTA